MVPVGSRQGGSLGSGLGLFVLIGEGNSTIISLECDILYSAKYFHVLYCGWLS